MNASLLRAAATAVMLMTATACSKDAQQSAQDYVASGDRFVAEQKYAEAVVEYRNALTQDPAGGETRYKLAKAYAGMGDSVNANKEFVLAAEVIPGNVEVQVNGAVALLRQRRFEEARERAEAALKLDPQNFQAQVVVGNALAGLRDFETALKELEEAVKLDPAVADLQTNIGAVQLALGNKREAEAAFRKAVELGPNEPSTHLALANFAWSSGKSDEAEQLLKRVLTINATHALAHRGLATLYMATRRLPLAEPHLKTLADADTSAAGTLKLSLVDYYVLVKKPEDALRVLDGMQNVKEGLSNVQTRIGMLRYTTTGPAEGNRIIDEVLKRDPAHVQARLTKARFQMAEGDLQAALKNATAAADADQRSAEARYMQGVIYRSLNQLEPASTAFLDVLKLNPRASGAQMQLAELNIALGRPAQAMPLASDVAAQFPRDVKPRLLLIRAQAAAGQMQLAQRSMASILKVLPNDPAVQATAGSLAMARRDYAGARRSLARALELDANSAEAFNGLIAVDLAERKPDAARARVDARLAKSPRDTVAMTTAARVYATTGDLKRAEELLRAVVAADASDLQAYGMLGQIYTMQRQLPQARATFEELLKKEPDSVSIQTMIGILLEAEGKSDEARKRYERVMDLDKGAAVAANNLAYIYTEQGGNLDVALALAQTAKQKMPDSGQVADTLGWIYVKKDLAKLAVSELELAVAKSPNSPNSHYHLGVALSKVGGQNARARRTLEKAIALKLEPAAAAEARKIAASL